MSQIKIPTYKELLVLCGEDAYSSDLELSVEASTLFGTILSDSMVWPESFQVEIGGSNYEMVRTNHKTRGEGTDSELTSVTYTSEKAVEYEFTVCVWND